MCYVNRGFKGLKVQNFGHHYLKKKCKSIKKKRCPVFCLYTMHTTKDNPQNFVERKQRIDPTNIHVQVSHEQ